MRVLLSSYGSPGSPGSRGDVERLVGLAAPLRALGAEMPVCAPPDFAAQFDTVAAGGLPRRVRRRTQSDP